MLTKADIDLLKSELIPAVSEQIKKDLTARLDWIATMLDKQSGNLQSVETELTIIRGMLESDTSDVSALKTRVGKVEKHLNLSTTP